MAQKVMMALLVCGHGYVCLCATCTVDVQWCMVLCAVSCCSCLVLVVVLASKSASYPLDVVPLLSSSNQVKNIAQPCTLRAL